MIKMKKRIDLKLFSILCIALLTILMLSTWAFAEKNDKVQELIVAEEGGSVTLGDVTVTFDPGVLSKDTKIKIKDVGDGVYQLGPEIKVNGTVTIEFADAPEGESEVETSVKGKDVSLTCTDGTIETDHFSRYRGGW
jgi:hypothetical protein